MTFAGRLLTAAESCVVSSLCDYLPFFHLLIKISEQFRYRTAHLRADLDRGTGRNGAVAVTSTERSPRRTSTVRY